MYAACRSQRVATVRRGDILAKMSPEELSALVNSVKRQHALAGQAWVADEASPEGNSFNSDRWLQHRVPQPRTARAFQTPVDLTVTACRSDSGGTMCSGSSIEGLDDIDSDSDSDSDHGR